MSFMLDLPGMAQPTGPQVSTTSPSGDLGPIKYGRLKRTNPRLDVERVRTLKALYRGGSALLQNPSILSRIFPKYVYESDGSYAERKQRAFYENMFALVINQISAGLAQDPLRISKEAGEPDPEEYWTELLDNATPLSDDGTSQRSLDQLWRDVCTEGLVTGWCWTQADLPKPELELAPESDAEPILPKSLGEQEEAGKLRAYLVQWPTESVTDWDEQKGKLLWLRTYECVVDASDPSLSRDDKTHVWTIWTPTKWFKYQIVEKKDQPLPNDEELIAVADSGDHSFGRVPWTRFDVSAGNGAQLWIGDIIESLCRNYFNRQNGESYQWTQFYYQQLYEFLAPEIAGIDTMVSEAQQDPARAQRRRAPGVVQVRGHEDDARFVGPNMSGANIGREAMIDLRDAILRVTQQMALAQDSNGALLRRSAQSKQQDAKGTEILLTAIGRRIIVAVNNSAELLAAGRGDAEAPKFTGYEKFEVSDMSLVLDQAAVAQAINVPSATYQIEMLYQMAIAHLGENISEDVKKKIRDELEGQITQDQFAIMPDEGENPWGDDPDAPPEDEESGEEEPGNEEEDDNDNPFPPRGKNAKKREAKHANPFAKKE